MTLTKISDGQKLGGRERGRCTILLNLVINVNFFFNLFSSFVNVLISVTVSLLELFTQD